MTDTSLQATILVVSDTASRDASKDETIPILKQVFAAQGQNKWSIIATAIVPDDIDAIRQQVKTWCQDGFNLVLTTGGTGFATKDVTPEAITPLLTRHAPGLVHGMLAKSLEITPFAMMSRPVAGVSDRTIVVTLPGSPKGARENLEAIIKLLPHACMQAAGMDSRTLHAGGTKKLEQDAGVSSTAKSDKHSHSHDHHHSHGHGHAIPRAHTRPEDRPKSNDPAAGPSQRYRESPYPMLSVQEAITTILSQTPDTKEISIPIAPEAILYTIAENVLAKEAVPAFRASIVDGYAIVISEDSPSSKGIFPVVSISHAAPGRVPLLQTGQVARITTGAPLPEGATSVVMVEDTVLRSSTADGKEEKEVEVLTDAIKVDENVREVGSDIKEGSVLLRKGDKIGPGELGLLASVGIAEVKVFSLPVVGVLSTGDEIVQHDRPGSLNLGEVRDCNRPAVMSVLQEAGYSVIDCGIASDSPGMLESTLRDSLRKCDVLITSGGVSMGELDLLKPTIERSLGGKVHFGRVSMKPGKPTTFATVQVKDNQGEDRKKLIFSLPGNPASAITCTNLFVLPSLAKASGRAVSLDDDSSLWKRLGRPRLTVLLAESAQCDASREEYQRAAVIVGNGGNLLASITGGQRSSRVGSFQRANALVVLPAGGGRLDKGTRVEALLIGPLMSI